MRETMTHDEKRKAYRRIAMDAIEYIGTCAEHGVRPLKHDADLLYRRFVKVDKAVIDG